MRLTQGQLRQIIREVLQSDALQNPLAGRNAAFAMAFSLSPFHPKQGHEIRSFHRLVEIFLDGPHRDKLKPEAQQDLAFISQQVRKGFNDPAYLSRADIEKAFFKIKELFGPDYDSTLINFYDGFESPLASGSLRASLDKINNALREISKETGYETSYVKGQRVGAILDGIAAFKSRLAAIPESDIDYLTRIHQSIALLSRLAPDSIDPDYKWNFASLINSGSGGVIQAAELIDVLNQPDETDENDVGDDQEESLSESLGADRSPGRLISRQIIKKELQREFMSSRSIKLSDFGGDLPPKEPPEPEPERGGPDGVKAWLVSPMEMRHDGGRGTEQAGRFIVGRSTLIEFLRKWGVSLPVTRRVKGDVDRVLAEIAASAFDDLEDDEDEDERGWNPQGDRPERPPRVSYSLVTLDFTGGSPPYAKVTRLDSY